MRANPRRATPHPPAAKGGQAHLPFQAVALELASLCRAPWFTLDVAPDRAALRRALGLPAGPRSCAVVGSSDLLRIGPPRGADIDRHGLIWRLNNAPTATFERLVGARTSVRLINHVPVRKWNLLAADRTALMRTVDGQEYDGQEYEALLCAPARSAPNASLEAGCVVSAQGAGGAQSLSTAVGTYRARHPSHRLVPMDAALQRLGSRCSSALGGTAPSGGLLAVLLALLACDGAVALYGFWPFCCRPHRGLPRMNYKYSQGNRTAWVCCSHGRERMEVADCDGSRRRGAPARSAARDARLTRGSPARAKVEFGFYETLQTRGLVKLHTAPALRPPAALADRPRGSAATSSFAGGSGKRGGVTSHARRDATALRPSHLRHPRYV